MRKLKEILGKSIKEDLNDPDNTEPQPTVGDGDGDGDKGETYTPNVDDLLITQSPDIKKFIAKHVIRKHPDRAGNTDKVYKASDEKVFDRKANRYGYAAGEDAAVYEGVEEVNHPEAIDERTGIERAAKTKLHQTQDGDHVAYSEHSPDEIAKGLTENGYDHDYTNTSGSMYTKWTNGLFHEVKIKPVGPNASHVSVFQNKSAWAPGQKNEEFKGLFEHLGSDASREDYIDDFVHSTNSKFDGKSKKERIRMALGAFYSNHKKNVSEAFEVKHVKGGVVKNKPIRLRKYVAQYKDGTTKAVFAPDEDGAHDLAGGKGLVRLVLMDDCQSEYISDTYNSLNEENQDLFVKKINGPEAKNVFKFISKLHEEVEVPPSRLKSIFYHHYDNFYKIHQKGNLNLENVHKMAVQHAENYMRDYYDVEPNQYRDAN